MFTIFVVKNAFFHLLTLYLLHFLVSYDSKVVYGLYMGLLEGGQGGVGRRGERDRERAQVSSSVVWFTVLQSYILYSLLSWVEWQSVLQVASRPRKSAQVFQVGSICCLPWCVLTGGRSLDRCSYMGCS